MSKKTQDIRKVECLRAYAAALRRITAKKERLAHMRMRLLPGAKAISGMPAGGIRRDFSDMADEVMLLEEQIRREIGALARVQENIVSVIDALEDPRMREVLEYRYLNEWSWQKIAWHMHCDASTAWRLHASALDRIDISGIEKIPA